MNIFKRLTIRYWAWIIAFLIVGFGWGSAIWIQPPPSYKGTIDLYSFFVMGLGANLGAVVTITGMIMTRALLRRIAVLGLWIELVGTVLLAGGPLQYLGLQIGYLVDGQWDQRYALAWFSLSLFAFVSVRFAILIPALIAETRANRRK